MLTRLTRRAVLRDRSGLETSIPELAVSTIVKGIVATAVASLLGGVLLFSGAATNSSATSSTFQTSNIQFAQAVAKSDKVLASGTDTVALLTSGSDCVVDVWHAGIGADGKPTLREDTTTKMGAACSAVTTIPTGTVPTGKELIPTLASLAFSYENIGGRVITYPSGTATLAPDSGAGDKAQPVSVSDDDWADVRPYKVQLDVTSAQDNLTAFSKAATFTGYTQIINAPQAATAPGDQRYVPPTVPLPSALRIVSAARSTLQGASVGGVLEGVKVSYTGAVCPAGPTNVTVAYNATSADGSKSTSLPMALTLTGALTAYDLKGVPNGSQGNVSVTADCGAGGQPITARMNFQQSLPATVVTVAEGNPFSTHVLSWTKVSSLPTTFTGKWTGNDGTSGTISSTSTLGATVVHPAYSTYGVTDAYTITATVNGTSVDSSAASIGHPWPTIPVAKGFSYGAASNAPARGTVSWSYSAGCPAGTTLYSQILENRTGQSNGTVSTATNYATGFKPAVTSYTWAPGYALQGYLYGITVQTECVITSTGAASPIASATYTWVVGMNRPGAPLWQSSNIYDRVPGTNYTHSTSPGVMTMLITYASYCPAGSSLASGTFVSHSWAGGAYAHPWNSNDWWQLPDGNARTVYYDSSTYTCSTPWTSTVSAVAGTNFVTVYP